MAVLYQVEVGTWSETLMSNGVDLAAAGGCGAHVGFEALERLFLVLGKELACLGKA